MGSGVSGTSGRFRTDGDYIVMGGDSANVVVLSKVTHMPDGSVNLKWVGTFGTFHDAHLEIQHLTADTTNAFQRIFPGA